MFEKIKSKFYNQTKEEELLKNGKAQIKCESCGKLFTAWLHFGTSCYVYDNQCEICRREL